jgi:hypothetical protein
MGAMTMLALLSGLGCHNKPDQTVDAPALYAPVEARAPQRCLSYESRMGPSGYYPRPDGRYTSHDSGGALVILRNTLYSMVFGHDPDVPTVGEIEASVYGYGPGH